MDLVGSKGDWQALKPMLWITRVSSRLKILDCLVLSLLMDHQRLR